MKPREATESEILDGIRMAHDFRALLWDTWGERSVPRLSVLQDECRLEVRGTDGRYVVSIKLRRNTDA